MVADKVVKRWAFALRRPARKSLGPQVLRMEAWGYPNPFGVHHSGLLLRLSPLLEVWKVQATLALLQKEERAEMSLHVVGRRLCR